YVGTSQPPPTRLHILGPSLENLYSLVYKTAVGKQKTQIASKMQVLLIDGSSLNFVSLGCAPLQKPKDRNRLRTAISPTALKPTFSPMSFSSKISLSFTG